MSDMSDSVMSRIAFDARRLLTSIKAFSFGSCLNNLWKMFGFFNSFFRKTSLDILPFSIFTIFLCNFFSLVFRIGFIDRMFPISYTAMM